jgi:valine dehydrogenase (NAD+)
VTTLHPSSPRSPDPAPAPRPTSASTSASTTASRTTSAPAADPGPAGRTSVFGQLAGHEQVVYCSDEPSGLRAIIAIHSTALGPALGGTRFYPYADEDAALRDVLALSRGMSFKAAAAGLDLGGGKAVIIGDPRRDKTEALLRAYGRFVQSLHGRYVTACDVGTFSPDMDVVARECSYVTGRSTHHGGAGDSSVLTAYGVLQGMRAAAEVAWGEPTLAERVVGVSGVGKVGRHLVEHLLQEGARVVVTDVDPAALAAVHDRHPEVRVVDQPDRLLGEELDVLSPCALGGVLDETTVPRLAARVVCGAANNQLANPGVDKLLVDQGVLYAPDYVVNAGGLIQVADELDGFSFERAQARAARIYDSTREVFRLAREDGVPPGAAADRLAERRIAEVGRLRGLWLG